MRALPWDGERARRYRSCLRRVIALGALCCASISSAAQQPRQTLTVDADGAVHIDGLVVPPSDLLSPEARKQLIARLTRPPVPVVMGDGVMIARAFTDRAQKTILEKWLAIYPSQIRPEMMNGVQTDIVIPDTGIAPENRRRVLINVHGGGFFAGARAGGQVESVPLAAHGRIKVVTVDYRMAPEAKFPAASEDVESVYRKLLETYKPENIGIYGCSAGGTLVAQSVAWLQHHHLPQPGAAGIFCSGAMPTFWYGGDSFAVTPMLNGRLSPTPTDMKAGAGNLYLAGIDQNDPLVTPGLFPEVLARFPPTMIVTSTRDSAMSNALVTNVRLLQAGVETQLLVLEGLGHGEFNTAVGTPEAEQAFDIIWKFFDRHLAR